MLVREILDGFGEAHSREAGAEERLVVPAAEEAVGAVDECDLHVYVLSGAGGDFGDEAAQVARGGVVLAADFAEELELVEG